MVRSTTSVSLSEHFTTFIDEQVESGRFASASDVVQAALDLLERQEKKSAELRSLIAEGIADLEAGRIYEDTDEFWEELDREVDERLTRGDQPGSHVLP